MLSADHLVRSGLLKDGSTGARRLVWGWGGHGQVVLSALIHADPGGSAGDWIDLICELGGETFHSRIRLVCTPLPWGGARWWFTCPIRRMRRGSR